MERSNLEGTLLQDLVEVLSPGGTVRRVWIDPPFLTLYQKWRLAGRGHDEVFALLRSAWTNREWSPDQEKLFVDGIAMLGRMFAGPLEVPHSAVLRPIEKKMVQKVLEGRYLFPEDVDLLPGGRLRFSAIVATIGRNVERESPRPEGWTGSSGIGVDIERRPDGSWWTHRRVEIGFLKESEPFSMSVPCLEDAVRLLLSDLWGSDFEELPIDWEA